MTNLTRETSSYRLSSALTHVRPLPLSASSVAELGGRVRTVAPVSQTLWGELCPQVGRPVSTSVAVAAAASTQFGTQTGTQAGADLTAQLGTRNASVVQHLDRDAIAGDLMNEFVKYDPGSPTLRPPL